MTSPAYTSSTNQLLAVLPSDERARLMVKAEHVRIPKGVTLFGTGENVHHAFFPLSGMISVLSTTADGRAVEVAVIGSEGMIGPPTILGEGGSPYQAMTQLPLEAVRVSAGVLRSEFERGGRLKDLLLDHMLGLLTQITQAASCHRFHTVEQRLARWLLMTRDRAGANQFYLTHESLSLMLGAPRTSITAFAIQMQREGLIAYSRGVISVLNTDGLEATFCDCYRNARQERKEH